MVSTILALYLLGIGLILNLGNSWDYGILNY